MATQSVGFRANHGSAKANIRVPHWTSRYRGGQSGRHNGGQAKHSESFWDTSRSVHIAKTYFESCTAGHISVLRDRVTRAVFASLGSPDAFSQSPPVLHNALRIGLPKKVGSAWMVCLCVPCSWTGEEESAASLGSLASQKKWWKIHLVKHKELQTICFVFHLLQNVKNLKERGDLVCGFSEFRERVLVLAHEHWALRFKAHHPWKCSQLQALNPWLIILQKVPTHPFATFEVCSCYFRAVPDLHPVIFLDSSFCFHGVYLPLTIQSSIGSTTKHMINIFWGENKLYLPVLYQPWWWCWNLWWY
jgi:hypothetical protein